MTHKPKIGIQGPVVSWQDPWAGDASDQVMRTGTGSVCPSQDAKPEPKHFLNALKELGAEFYVHNTIPGMDFEEDLMKDLIETGMDIVLGNEYGNINGPYVEGTNRHDVPDEAVIRAGKSGKCIGLLYDEPEHLQINVMQYRKDGWFPHFGDTDNMTLDEARNKVEQAVAARDRHVRSLLRGLGAAENSMPLIAEQVFPTMFYTLARGGMDVSPKIMKESFQSLQLSTAIGAAKQYNRNLWICADLWGPDVGEWFTRFQGFPGHSPEEFASALRMGYYMGPSHLFAENIDVLLKYRDSNFIKSEFGEVWDEFIHKFIPENPLTWDFTMADPDIVIIHSDDSNYGQNARIFGSRTWDDVAPSQSIFHIWHLLSRGAIPAHGSCQHIPGFDFPRHVLKKNVPIEQFPLENGYAFDQDKWVHPLFYPVNNVLAYDAHVSEQQLGQPKLILVGGSSVSAETLAAVRKRAEQGATVVVAEWLLNGTADAKLRNSGKSGEGQWIVTGDFLSGQVKEAVEPFLGQEKRWMQRFGQTEVRMYAKDERGFTLDFEIAKI
jgi:hypothetical protein